MIYSAKLLAAAAVVCGSLFFTASAEAQNQNCQACPGTHFCACVNCAPCNSGAFAWQCMCYRGVAGQPPVNYCSGADGVCNGNCAKCVTQDAKTGRTCTGYAGCPGQSCPVGGCVPPLRAAAALPCEGCRIKELEDRSAERPVRVRLETPSEFPIELIDVVIEDGGATKDIRIRNDARVGLVTLLLAFTYRAPDGEVATSIVKADSWHMDTPFLAPGSTDTVPQMTRAIHPNGIASVQVRPVYAEFEDGTRLGPDALGTSVCVSRQRAVLTAKMEAARARIEQAGSTLAAVRSAIQAEDDLSFLQVDLNRGGVDAVLARLRTPRRFAR